MLSQNHAIHMTLKYLGCTLREAILLVKEWFPKNTDDELYIPFYTLEEKINLYQLEEIK